jgi:hypothetical protein
MPRLHKPVQQKRGGAQKRRQYPYFMPHLPQFPLQPPQFPLQLPQFPPQLPLSGQPMHFLPLFLAR